MKKHKYILITLIISCLLIADSCKKIGLNVPPGYVVLLSPQDASTDLPLDLELLWQESIDSDGDVVKYDVFIGTEENSLQNVSIRQEETFYKTDLHSMTTYYWRIVARDGIEGLSESPIWHFKTGNQDPDTVILKSPADSTMNVELNVILEWETAIDPDDDSVRYDVYFDTKPTPQTKVSSDQAGTSFTSTLSENTIYYWNVIGKDGKGGLSISAVWSFTTIGTNNAPGEVTLLSPVNAPIVDIGDVALDASLTWQATIDPDGDVLRYDIYFDTSANPTSKVSSDQLGTSFSPTLSENTIYYWKVVANDGKGGVSESPIWGFRTITPNRSPGEFSLTSPVNDAINVSHDDAILTWQAAIDPDGDILVYDVLISTNSNPTTVISSGSTSTSFVPTLDAGMTYYWKVIAKDGKGGIRESAVWSFSTIIPSSPPSSFTLKSPGNGTTDNLYIDFLLEWNASTDPDGDAISYDVLLSTSAIPTTVISENQMGTSFGPTLSNGTTYYWKVVAKDDKGKTRESDVWSFSTRNHEPGEINLTAPDDAEPDVALDVDLTWDVPFDQDGDVLTYDVYFGTNANPTTKVSTGQTGTSYSPSLSESTTYFWKIEAHDGKGGIGYSPVWSFTTLNPNSPPGAYNLIWPESGAINVPFDDEVLRWDAAIDPDGDLVTYDVLLSTDSNPIAVISAGQSETSFTPTLAGGTTYYWKVVAYDGKGGIRETVVWEFTTRDSNKPPGDFNLLSPGNKTLNVEIGTALTWEAAVDPDGNMVMYDVYFGTDPDARTVVSKNQLGTTFSPLLQKGYNYYWKVVAKDGLGGTKESAIWTFRTVPAL